MTNINVAGFERKFWRNSDPWNYEGSRFERFKRRVLLCACGDRLYGRGLELGCANGVTTRELARICLSLHAIDASPTALRLARERCAAGALSSRRPPQFFEATLPCPFPGTSYDLIVVSELAYYLNMRALRQLSLRIGASLAAGGRLVLLHHLTPFDDAAQPPAMAHQHMAAWFSQRLDRKLRQRRGRFEVVALDRPYHQPACGPDP